MKLIHSFKNSSSVRDVVAAASIVVLAGSLFLSRVWVFRNRHLPGRGDSFWHTVLSDRATLGLIRMVAATLALYALTSIAVLVVRGRWLRAISATGLEVEDAKVSADLVESLKAELRTVREDRDAAWRLVWRLHRG